MRSETTDVEVRARLAAAEARLAVLEDSERKFRTLFETMEQGYVEAEIVRDAQGRAVDCRLLELNPAFERLTGVSAAIARGRTNQELFPGIDDWWPLTADRIQRSGAPERVEYQVAPLGRTYQVYFYPGTDDRFTALYEEITERKRAADALGASEAQLAAAFESVPVGLAVVGLDGRATLANDHYRRFLPTGVIPSRDGPDRIKRWRAWDADGEPLAPSDFPGARALRGVRVVPGQAMLYTGDDGREIWTSVSTVPTQDAAGEVTGLVTVISDIDALKRSAELLREGEERQAFLLQLSDALRPLADPQDITGVAARLLGQFVGASRAYYVEWPLGEDYGEVARDYAVDGLASLTGRYPSPVFVSAYERISQGRTWIVDDAANDGAMAEAERQYYLDNGVTAWVDVPLIKQGQVQAALCLVQAQPRRWTAAEIAMAEETAERCWAAIERARAEAALQISEERFQQFAKASAAGLWIRNADTLNMEFVSPAIGLIYGVEPDALLGDVRRWAAMIVPEDRDTALSNLEAARAGETVVHEFRIQRPSDGVFRWIRNTDFPLHDEGHIGRIGGIAEDVTETRRLTEHQHVLLAELQHRVRNIMGMIRSTANRTAGGATDVQDYRALLEGRLLALARVQVLLTREANAGGALRHVIESEVSVQATHGEQFELLGPEIRLSPKAVEVLTLAFHELSTNALKYGAFSAPGGHLRVSWEVVDKHGRPWVALDWTETGAPIREPSTRRGFGSDLIEGRIPYELGGVGKITIKPEGAHCHLEFPLKAGESILETDAPSPATIFGGSLDMSDAPDLTGRQVLVVEDDYYSASDTVAALRGAGAEVLGPCPSEEATLELLDSRTPSHAVLDLNLGGGGPRFEIAKRLKQRGVPFIFLTGYDPQVIPEPLRDVVRLQKPVTFRAIVEALSALRRAPL